MVERFKFWILGIIEDNPIPEEIDIIIFNIKSNGKYKYLELLGLEKVANLNKISYYPLEAQFFSIYPILTNNKELLLYRVKALIEECFEDNLVINELKSKKIYLNFDIPLFLFKV